jgi:D-3-phosphoglycerate dehydrogenase
MPQVKVVNDINAVIAQSDYVTLHLPLNNDTKYMFNEELLNKAKDGLRLLNFARGELVCTDSVKKAIESGKVSCYVTDFPNGDALGNDKIITVPHLGASTPESEENCAFMAGNEIREYLEFGNIVNSVNFPNCELDFTGKKRICVLSKKDCLNKLSEVITGAGNNISAMVSKERNGYYYSIFDVEDELKDVSAIKNIEGVLKFRSI